MVHKEHMGFVQQPLLISIALRHTSEQKRMHGKRFVLDLLDPSRATLLSGNMALEEVLMSMSSHAAADAAAA